MRVVEPVVGAHDIACTSTECICEGPQIELMQGLVINIRGDGLNGVNLSIRGGVPVSLLFVTNEVLASC